MIDSIEYFQVKIPFTTSFKHGSAERSETETVIVKVRGEHGLTGYGEGCPRSYVTGESIKSASVFYVGNHAGFQQISSLDDLKTFVISNREAIDNNPAAWCAVELAILDLLSKSAGVTVESLLNREESRESYIYSAVLGDSGPVRFSELYEQYKELGFTDYKIKLSSDISKEISKLECLSKDMPNINIRADANNQWSTKEEAVNYLNKLDVPFSSIEEPITSNQHGNLLLFAKEVGVKVILDESFMRYDQLELLASSPSSWIVNIRVSKMGGILRSLEIIDALIRLGVQITVGAQVGETSLLTRAALILADAAGENLSAQEGAFGTLLLERDLFNPMLQFGIGGRLTVERGFRSEPGFGLNLTTGIDDDPYITPLE